MHSNVKEIIDNFYVLAAGPTKDGYVFINLKGVSKAINDWYIAVDSQKDKMLSVALAAISTGKTVYAALTGTAMNSTIEALYLNA